MAFASPVLVDIWSDYVCPFCYLELPAVIKLQQNFGEGVTVRWHAFELRPEPAPTLDPNGAYLHDIWARSVYPMAAERDMRLRLPPVQPRSRKAFEAVAHARSVGQFDAMHAALFRAFFEDGMDIGDTAVLLHIGDSLGLDRQRLQRALEEDEYTREVLAEEGQARQLGISGVPLILVRRTADPLGEASVLRGAVSYSMLHATVADLVE